MLTCLSIQPISEDALPTEFRLLKWGINRAWKMGQGDIEITFDQRSADQIMSAFKDSGIDRIAIDAEHQTFASAENGKPAPAYGWFVPEVRNDGLYATQVKWTPDGEDLLKSKAYRFYSPTVITDKSGRATRLLPIALTNFPALKDLAPLVAAKAISKESPKMKNLLIALGCAEDAEEVIALSAVEQLKSTTSQLLALSGKETVAEALGALHAMKEQAAQAASLSAEVAQLKAEKLDAQINGLVDEAVKDGRLAPAKRAEVIALSAKLGVDGLKSFLSMLSVQPAQSKPAEQPKEEPKTIALGADAKAFMKEFGLTPELKPVSPSIPLAVGQDDASSIAQLFGVNRDSLTNHKPSLPVGTDR